MLPSNTAKPTTYTQYKILASRACSLRVGPSSHSSVCVRIQVVVGVAGVIKGAVDGSKNPHSMAKILAGTEHGLPMFDKHPSLEPELVSWLKTQLLSN